MTVFHMTVCREGAIEDGSGSVKGTGISVFGRVLPNDPATGIFPPAANYTIDGMQYPSANLSSSQQPICQTMFTTPTPLSDAEHLLIITVTNATILSPFSLSLFAINATTEDNSNLTSFPSSSNHSMPYQSSGKHPKNTGDSDKIVIIVVAVLGSIVVLLITAMLLFFYFRQRRTKKTHTFSDKLRDRWIADSPTFDTRGAPTLTRTDSIMHNNPSHFSFPLPYNPSSETAHSPALSPVELKTPIKSDV
ncbi:hypothetical protein HETIRDRAFT_460285 [Heterobasidion irregulare TC 32-1]|uniref:Mid2 domain-containing protein n=1 Tax=Heterobasidion irregulare (strain TC 32-1) TaxID=747525 RepID=W4JWG5_HETIT|nr:uncharacterized protein HETIRDRAFT_460285 [Heterobasidion irregulare TC 32-1]ETW77908.1 hypothetical protein HETIRDRAFT_460285 [Heterobasidion irregulare TC 32-1]